MQTLGPTIDEDWFPRTLRSDYWTGTVLAINELLAGYVGFYSGRSDFDLRDSSGEERAVRLVRDVRPAPSASKRFVANGDEVLDRATKLVWRRCAEDDVWNGAACEDADGGGFRWIDTFERAKSVSLQTGKAWRVPNAKEMLSLVDESLAGDVLMDVEAFPGYQPDRAWTSTISVSDRAHVWLVFFDDGSFNTISTRLYTFGLRLVRDGD